MVDKIFDVAIPFGVSLVGIIFMIFARKMAEVAVRRHEKVFHVTPSRTFYLTFLISYYAIGAILALGGFFYLIIKVIILLTG